VAWLAQVGAVPQVDFGSLYHMIMATCTTDLWHEAICGARPVPHIRSRSYSGRLRAVEVRGGVHADQGCRGCAEERGLFGVPYLSRTPLHVTPLHVRLSAAEPATVSKPRKPSPARWCTGLWNKVTASARFHSCAGERVTPDRRLPSSSSSMPRVGVARCTGVGGSVATIL
jgi:hypothetical protein